MSDRGVYRRNYVRVTHTCRSTSTGELDLLRCGGSGFRFRISMILMPTLSNQAITLHPPSEDGRAFANC
eukprot:619482-Prorocentrum_minimum.AAC.1